MSRNKYQEDFIIDVMNRGFARAAHSFAKLMGKSVKITSTKAGLIEHPYRFFYTDVKNVTFYVLLTQIIGELSGKSYLILNASECNALYDILKINEAPVELKEGLLLEIDNVISASVISELSNALGLEIYGDVPLLKRINSEDMQGYIEDEAGICNASSVLFATTNLCFDDEVDVNPKFIWKLSTRVFDRIPAGKISVN
jgi:chemotaxis protein CheY-P-specific phosphatase CheC